MLYLEDKDIESKATKLADLMPETDDTFRPSGAVTDMYGMRDYHSPVVKDNQTENDSSAQGKGEEEGKFCFQCGSRLKASSRFCRNCGVKQI
jgi:hypothetical protein